MKLRELINRLEELSENGKYDDMEVVYNDISEIYPIDLIKIRNNQIEMIL